MSLNVSLLRSSFDLVVARQAQITPRFYEILFERYPQVRPLFSRNSRAQQAEMLQGAIVAVMDHLEDATWLQQTLESMGAKHVDYEVTDEMYAWVGDSLIRTLAEIAGKDWTAEHAEAWGDAYTAIAGLMQKGARDRLAASA
ncbi:MAG: globin domain-containing protein [Myxococcales bacterium]